MSRIAPYGSWPSPLGAAEVAAASVRLGAPRVDAGTAYWTESRPAEGGRSVLVRRAPGGPATDVTPAGFGVRSRVHEYGGGAFAVRGGTVYFVNLADQRLYRQGPGHDPVPLGGPGPWRHADLVPDPARGRILCVREELSAAGDSRCSLVALRLEAGRDESARPLVAGPDFLASPRPSPDGRRLAWIEWDHPDMPWDAGRLRVAAIRPDGSVAPPVTVAGGAGESVFQPEWGTDGGLYFVSDRSGWWNLYRWRDGRDEALAPTEAEFGLPQWQFGMSTYALLGNGSVVCAFTRDGAWQIGRIATPGAALETLPTPFTLVGDVQADGGGVVLTAAGPTADVAVVRLDLAAGRIEVLREPAPTPLAPAWVSRPEPIAFPSAGGTLAHALFYRPRNAEAGGPAHERPPLLVRCHGGPTAAATPSFDPVVQYWTTRGFAFADVNYGGSTGYGRRYRERLDGGWGEVDVDDCVAAARHLAARGDVDPERLAVRGSSAGGFTVLAALAFRDVFRAGAAYYGVSDLETLVRDTHKFESHYLDRLVGPYPAAAETYRARSPLHHAERITAPVIFFQGLEDRVVPPDQTERMVSALRQRGVPVEYHAFPGEQHGFRQSETIRRCLEAELAFYLRAFGLGSTSA
jgi:dipeptidyl aminopeptidase/acylaminoacyl peptidase